MALSNYLQMLAWKRPSGSFEAKLFGELFLAPFMGPADKNGNYTLVMGKDPKVAYTAHYDTVHKTGGLQRVIAKEGIVTSEGNECLGADCTSGIYLILEMIKIGIDGVYCIFADEEIGCVGSTAMAEDLKRSLDMNLYHPLASCEIMISFDRMGDNSIITHQSGYRTASDEFAKSLSAELEMGHIPDNTGSYTDSNEFASIIPECTNLSVGYIGQHTANEDQDFNYLSDLLYSLTFVDVAALVVSRDPTVEEVLSYTYGYKMDWEKDTELELVDQMVYENTELIAHLLIDLGYGSNELIDELAIEHPWYSHNYRAM